MGQSTRRIQQQQDSLLEEMGRIRVMRRGTVSRQQYLERCARKEGTCGFRGKAITRSD